MKNLLFVILSFSFIFSQAALAQQKKVAAKPAPAGQKKKVVKPTGPILPEGTWSFKKAEAGTCLKDLTTETNKTMSEHGVKTVGVPFDKVQKIADALVLMDQLYGDQVPFFKQGVTIKLKSKFNHLGKQFSPTEIWVGKRGSAFVSIYIHEMAHIIGNTDKNGSSIYSQYNEFVTKKCRLTQYSGKNLGNGSRNEEFAEAFTGYLLMPEELTSEGCRMARAYFNEKLFPGPKKHSCLAAPKVDQKKD